MRLAALLALGLVLAAFVPAMATQAQTPSPDLAVTHVGWDQLVEGDDTTFNATIRNDGDAAYDEDAFDVRFHLEDDGFDETVTVQLEEEMAAGEERNVSASTPWEAEIGTFTINATVEEDEGGLPGFGDDLEDNDHRNRTFAIGPDIVTNQVRLEPSSPIAEQSVTFFAEIENDASDDHDVTEPFIVSFEVRDGDTTVATIESMPLDELRAKDPQEITARTDWDAEAGSYTVVARADPDGNVTEADEANNEAERAFSVKAAVPDLAVTDVAPADPDVAADEESPIEATIENRGTADVTSDFPVRFRVDGTTHGPDVHVQVGDGLKPGGEVTVESEPWVASEGHHELVAIADPGNNNVTDETKLANNELAREVHVGPDLVVDDILWTPDPPAAEHEVTIEPVVRNQGTADVTQQTTLELRLPDHDESWTVDVEPIGAGNATQLEAATWTPPEDDTDAYPYDVTVEAETDVDDEASEIDDDNNVAQETMTVTEPRPDIVTEAIELDPASPAVGEETHIEATIRNDGSAEAAEVEVAFLVDDETHGGTRTIASGQFESLGAGEEATVTSDAWEPSLGEHVITVHPSLADETAEEVREDNNNATLEALVGPDALVEDIAWDPQDPEADDEVTFEVTVANAGTETIDELALTVQVDGEDVGDRTVEDLDADSNRTVEVSWNATEGDHTVRAIADPGEELAEAREANNQREESFSTTASPDLQPTSVRWSEEPEAGDQLVFTATIANTGTAPVEGSFTVSFHVGDDAIGTATLEGLEEGSSKSVSSDAWTAEAGTRTVTVLADADDAVTEDNEGNNDRVSVVTVRDRPDDEEPETGPPNLVVTGLSAPDDVEPGDEVTFLATIENTGGQRAGATDVRFLLEDEVLGEPRLDALAPGQSHSVTSEAWNATPGEHAITAIADVRDDVDESDEEDNERITRIQVGDVDDGDDDEAGGVALGAISIEDPRAGEPVRPSVQVTNNGDEARDVTVTFYVDGTRLGEGTLDDLGPGEEDTLQGPVWEPTRGEHTITARSDDDQTEAIVDVAAAEDPADAPVLPIALMLASLAAASLVRRRR